MKKFLKSFVYAFNGMCVAFKEELSLKLEGIFAIATVSVGFYFEISDVEWCIVLLTIGLVLSLEMLNSSIETLVDFVSLERHPMLGKVKDIAAGAVLLASIIAVIVGLVVFGKYFWALYQ
jgi:diacylglycerol kinase